MSSTRLSTPKSVNACAGMGGDAREDVGQPGLRIEPFIFAVYAAQRTMPKGAGDDQLLRRVARCSTMLARDPFGIVQVVRAPRGRQAGGRWGGSGALCALVLELGERCLLEREVGMQVGLRRLDGFMPEPQRDHGAVHPRLQQFHRCTVPQHMRRHLFGSA